MLNGMAAARQLACAPTPFLRHLLDETEQLVPYCWLLPLSWLRLLRLRTFHFPFFSVAAASTDRTSRTFGAPTFFLQPFTHLISQPPYAEYGFQSVDAAAKEKIGDSPNFSIDCIYNIQFWRDFHGLNMVRKVCGCCFVVAGVGVLHAH